MICIIENILTLYKNCNLMNSTVKGRLGSSEAPNVNQAFLHYTRWIHTFILGEACLMWTVSSMKRFLQDFNSGPEQLVCEAETHGKQPLLLSRARTKDEEDKRKRMVRARKHTNRHIRTHTQRMKGNQRGYSLCWKEHPLKCFKAQAE